MRTDTDGASRVDFILEENDDGEKHCYPSSNVFLSPTFKAITGISAILCPEKHCLEMEVRS